MMKEELCKKRMKVSQFAMSVLRNGRIIGNNETPESMVGRVSKTLFGVEQSFGTDTVESKRYESAFTELLYERKVVMSTPIMTNAGNYTARPLSACTVVPLRESTSATATDQLVRSLHIEGMGTGFRLDGLGDPIRTLKHLNDISVDNAESGKEDRPVGNMAIMSVHNPHIREFVIIKNESLKHGTRWKFNLSVDVTDAFMKAVFAKEAYTLEDGSKADAVEMFDLIAKMAHACGDPGIVFMERFNSDNPAPALGSYVSPAPCAEVGLVPGETCQFGYLNLGMFVKSVGGTREVDYRSLDAATEILTRALDNALEISMPNYTYKMNRQVMAARRKIGIGICGLADMFGILHLPYESEEARRTAVDIVARINYISKSASVKLARERGAFGAFGLSKYVHSPNYIESKYANVTSRTVTTDSWKVLAEEIKGDGIRNITTVALPPTGRSALTIDASTGIAPFFSLVDGSGNINSYLLEELHAIGADRDDVLEKIRHTGKISDIDGIPKDVKAAFKTALEIRPDASLKMQAALQTVVDDAISNTINLDESANHEDIARIYMEAYSSGLKGITVFRMNKDIRNPKLLAR